MPTYNAMPAFPPIGQQGQQVHPAANQIFYLADEDSLECRLHFGNTRRSPQQETWHQSFINMLTKLLIGDAQTAGINPLCVAHRTMGELLRDAREEARLDGREFYGVICEPERPNEERTLEGRRRALPTSDKEVIV